LAWIAIKMLVGDKAKFLGIVLGLTFASLLITQQGSIFCGLMLRTCAQITDITGADLWVMDPWVRYIDDVKPMLESNLYRVRGVEGVLWAVPLYKGQARAKINPEVSHGNQETVIEQVILLGLDDASLVGAPASDKMLAGNLRWLRLPDAVLVDNVRLQKLYPLENWDALSQSGNGFYKRFLGRQFEMNDHRAVIVGVCEATRTFQSNPVVYTTYSRAKTYAPQERKILSYILAKTEPGMAPEIVARRIWAATGLGTLTSEGFMRKTIMYYMVYTGIPINFGITAFLGFLVGTAIAGQTFYNFTLENLRQFGALKAMGATNLRIVSMILLQALVVGLLGYGLGVGLASASGWLTQSPTSDLAFFYDYRGLLFRAVCGLSLSVLLLGRLRIVAWSAARHAVLIVLLGSSAAFCMAWSVSGLEKDQELAFFTWWPILPVTAAAIVFICVLSSLLCIRRVVVLEPAIVFRS
jgi:putative ABC transport system permease protein